ncbi:hypothetical protein [Hyphomicrobium sp. CS1GBMeth3]|uniref:hypothetical protein n=1 Tax=Hyphomicrobium sp. CS1GBMeth3 TaxID=1892845 RepID=UPI000930EAC8|nr:hypothetical protein [Hyphomicrobium sp. CS1GBMeth3]
MSSGVLELEAPDEKRRAAIELACIAGLVIVSLLSIGLFNSSVKAFYKFAATQSAAVGFLPIGAATLMAIPFLRVRGTHFIPLLRIALISSSLGMLAYLLFERPDYTLSDPAFSGAAAYIGYAYYLVVGLAVASVVFPALNIPVAIYIISTTALIAPISGIPSSTLDIRYMVDMAVYLTVFPIGLRLIASRLGASFEQQRHQQTLAFIGFGLHLSNYFWSGVAKIVVGPYFWTWPLENKTHNLIPYAIDKGTLVFGQFPFLVDVAHSGSALMIVPLNILIVGFQLFAIACVLRRSWLVVTTLFYDLMHIGIYVLGGILFWTWIWNNFTILLAVNAFKERISQAAKAACVFTILLGNPWAGLYGSARLGWFDVADARQIYFEAVTDNGEVRVPASFFLSHSYGVSLGYVDTLPRSGHYGPSNWNTVRDYTRQLTSGTCPAPESGPAKGEETAGQREMRLAKLGGFVRAHHDKMLDRAAALGKNNFYFRIHHHPSNPYLFPEFGRLDLKDVRAYNLVIESACYQLREGQVVKRVVGRTVERFDVAHR